MSSVRNPAGLALVTVAGPLSTRLALKPPGPLTIGRRSEHDLVLGDPVSRDHAVLTCDGTGSSMRWCITDTNSKHGTRLNGVKLEPMRPYPIQRGDLLDLHPFTLELIDPDASDTNTTVVQTVDDSTAADSTVAQVADVRRTDATRQMLDLLLQCAERIHAADDEQSLADAVLDAAVVGTGYCNAAFLRPMSADGSISVLGRRGAVGGDSQLRLSRSLIMQAGTGVPATLKRDHQEPFDMKASVVSFGINHALCVPIMLQKSLAGYLYLDSRREDSARRRHGDDETIAFAAGIARMAAMALSNLRRMDLQRRFAMVESDLAAAAEAQRWVLPPRQGRHGLMSYIGECRPGRVVSGDFFDVISLAEDTMAISLGDVTGKGLESSVLMTATQGYLHAALLQQSGLSQAVQGVNAFIHQRCDGAHFVTLWTGVLDAAAGTLTYVDAGHGYALLIRSDGTTLSLDGKGGPPIGVTPDQRYASVQIAIGPGDQVLVVSDGIVEQPARNAPKRDEFGLQGVLSAIADLPNGADAVQSVFTAVSDHAGGKALADDATVLLVNLGRG